MGAQVGGQGRVLWASWMRPLRASVSRSVASDIAVIRSVGRGRLSHPGAF